MAPAAGDAAPLAGVRVLDLTQVIAGPFCTTMLADMGAEVVKLERRGEGDSLRGVGRYKGRADHEDYFYANNRNKKSIELDLKVGADLATALDLAAAADVLVENYAAGTADRLGIGYAAVRARNPRIVYCSISGFGQTGPYRDRTALDPVIQAVSGLMSVTGFPDGDPTMVGAPLGDVIAGMFGAYSIVCALRTVRSTREGQFIDISMQAAMLSALGPRMGETLQAGIAPARHGNQNPMRVPADTYRTADDRYVSVMCHGDGQWQPLCRAVERPDWAADPRFSSMTGRVDHRAELTRLFRGAFEERTGAEWAERLEAERIPFAFINDYAEALDDPQVHHRGQVRSIEHPVSGTIRVVGPAWAMSGYASPMAPPPLLGEHSAEVLAAWLGRKDEA
jgi:crotonobetainyl-CoA:carnitine CoA-transferase CaiB-like acyl-CoA transferase